MKELLSSDALKKSFGILYKILFFICLYFVSFYIAYNFMNYTKASNPEEKFLIEEKKEVTAKPYNNNFRLGSEVFFEEHIDLIKGKTIALITNETGVNSRGESTAKLLLSLEETDLKMLYPPEQWMDKRYDIKNVDMLIYDVQDYGFKTDTYIIDLSNWLKAAKDNNKSILVLDRPNPFGGNLVEGVMLEESNNLRNLPLFHGMTCGEIAQFFNSNIKADLKVIPMKGYNRNMTYKDTELKWVANSEYISNIEALYLYGVRLVLGDDNIKNKNLKLIDCKGVDTNKLAELLKEANLSGIEFISKENGLLMNITDYKTFNPFNVAINLLYNIRKLKVTEEKYNLKAIDKIDEYINKGYTPKKIESIYKPKIERFNSERKKYLIYNN